MSAGQVRAAGDEGPGEEMRSGHGAWRAEFVRWQRPPRYESPHA